MNKSDRFANLPSVDESVQRRPTSARAAFVVPPEEVGRDRARDVWTIDVGRIIPDPDQPRKEFDPEALERLAASLRAKGQLQPIQVRWDEAADKYVVLMGERRWRAAQVAGLDKLLCVVRTAPLDGREKLALQLVENCLREDLSPMEQARAFRTLMEDRGWTMEQLAAELSVSRPAVVRALALLRLPEAVQEKVEQGGLTPSSAYEISQLDDPAAQVRLAETAVAQGLSRDDVAAQVRSKPRKKAAARKVPTTRVYRFGGYKITIERKAGIEPGSASAALRDAADHESGDSAQEAA